MRSKLKIKIKGEYTIYIYILAVSWRGFVISRTIFQIKIYLARRERLLRLIALFFARSVSLRKRKNLYIYIYIYKRPCSRYTRWPWSFSPCHVYHRSTTTNFIPRNSATKTAFMRRFFSPLPPPYPRLAKISMSGDNFFQRVYRLKRCNVANLQGGKKKKEK